MQRISSILIISLAVLLFGSCATSLKILYDYDKEEDFSKFRSYAFILVPENLESDVNPDVVRRIEEAVALMLGKKGFQRLDANPDLLVAIHTERHDKLSVSNWGYNYAPHDLYWRGSGYWGAGGMDVHRYAEGTLIIDVVHAKDKELIWRGMGSKAFPAEPTLEQIEKTVNKAVAKLLSNFPPKK